MEEKGSQPRRSTGEMQNPYKPKVHCIHGNVNKMKMALASEGIPHELWWTHALVVANSYTIFSLEHMKNWMSQS